MITHSLFRHLLSDIQSLERYRDRLPVTISNIQCSLLLIERRYNVYVPDHYYRLALEKTFINNQHDKIDTIQHVFTRGLTSLADDYLDIKDKHIYVRANKFNEWQSVLSCMPPLILIAAKLWKTFRLDKSNLYAYICDYILPNTLYTALLSPHIRQLEDLKKHHQGLQDLHIHLNGALETDTVWQDLLKYPEMIRDTIVPFFDHPKVKELCAQLSPRLATPNELYKMMLIARILRWIMFEYIIGGSGVTIQTNGINVSRQEFLCNELNLQLDGNVTNQLPLRKHPMEDLLDTSVGLVQCECLMYIMIFDTLHRVNDEKLANYFHFYLLILGFSNMLMVQHWQHFGFEEFQKYTLNGIREFSEKSYKRRFHQMAGNELNHISLLEGRFSPKDNRDGNIELIKAIVDGWDTLCRHSINKQQKISQKIYGISIGSNDNDLHNIDQTLDSYHTNNHTISTPTLKLIAHFIKQPDKSKDKLIRHRSLRNSLMQRAQILRLMKENNDRYAQLITGIDAAASEFDTPPEVFAAVYKMLRKAGYSHFTYHAGEDFFHILSGLRAIYEAVEFLDLHRGDRIGHASACGVSVSLWRENIGEKILLRRGEYLDDLIFTRNLIIELKLRELYSFIPLLNDRISTLSSKIYLENYDTDTLTSSWRIRYRNPEELLTQKGQGIELSRAENIFLDYHSYETVHRYNEIDEFDTYDILGEHELCQLQLGLLRWLAEREIVIETLPTSNVVIGHHHGYNSYHLYNWLQWKRNGHLIPPIVVGTDDTGIFATNIYNEYCSIYCNLLYDKKMSSTDIIHFIQDLDYNARLYNFCND